LCFAWQDVGAANIIVFCNAHSRIFHEHLNRRQTFCQAAFFKKLMVPLSSLARFFLPARVRHNFINCNLRVPLDAFIDIKAHDFMKNG
jgi:hypothetical protein